MRLSIHIHNSRKTVKKANTLLDSGAASTFINKDIVEEYGWETKQLEKPFRLINADGTPNEDEVRETILIQYFIKNPKTKERVFQQM
jgi:siroheme synthase (precorrin-2 oxidase/ferrochelatase)